METEFSFDEVVAELRRGDAVRWQNIIHTAAKALEDQQAWGLASVLWNLDEEFDALLEVNPEDD